MHAVLDRIAALPQGVRTVAVLVTAGTAVLAVCGLVLWMLVARRRAPARA